MVLSLICAGRGDRRPVSNPEHLLQTVKASGGTSSPEEKAVHSPAERLQGGVSTSPSAASSATPGPEGTFQPHPSDRTGARTGIDEVHREGSQGCLRHGRPRQAHSSSCTVVAVSAPRWHVPWHPAHRTHTTTESLGLLVGLPCSVPGSVQKVTRTKSCGKSP